MAAVCRTSLTILQRHTRTVCLLKQFTNSAVMYQPRGNQPRLRETLPPGSEYEGSSKLSASAASDLNKQSRWPESQITPRETELMPDSIREEILDLSERQVDILLKEDSKEAQNFYRLIVTSEAKDVLGFIFRNHRVLNKVHFALALKRLFRILKKLDEKEAEMFKMDLKNNREFQVLCALLALKGSYYEADIVADMTDFMRHLGLDTDHPSMKVYLQLLKYHLNDLHLGSLVRISFSLTRMTSSDQTQLLQHAISILCNHRNRDLAALNTWQLVTLLDIHSPVLEEEMVLSLLDFILENKYDLTVRLSAIVLRGLGKMGLEKKMDNSEILSVAKDIMNVCVDNCIYALEKVSREEIISLLDSCTKLRVYDYELYDKAGDRFSAEDCCFDERLQVLKSLHILGHHHKSLVNTFRISLCQNTEYISECSIADVMDIFNIMSNFASPADIQNNAVNTREWISTMISRIEDAWKQLGNSERRCCLLNLELWGHRTKAKELYSQCDASIEVRDIDVFPTGFHEDLLLAKIGDGHISSSGQLWRTDLSVEFGRVLNLALGDKRLIHSPEENIFGLPVDYLVYVDDEGNPRLKLDDKSGVTQSSGVHPVAILVLRSNSFHNNTKQLRGICLIWPRLLQEAGMQVVVINHGEWRTLAEQDRLPYLRRRLKMAREDQDLWMFPI